MAEITTLIDKLDNKSIVRDQIAGLLVLESKEQQDLALAAGKDPRRWKLDVYMERSNPWGDYIDAIDDVEQAPRVVNISFDRMVYDGAKSSVVDMQQGTATYNIDCFGYGKSRSDHQQYGHISGDLDARNAAERTLMLARNILMSAHYVYLGLKGTVTRRWPEIEEAQDIPVGEPNAVHVAVARLRLEVDFPEYAPQVEGAIMDPDSVYTTVRRAETGQVYFSATY